MQFAVADHALFLATNDLILMSSGSIPLPTRPILLVHWLTLSFHFLSNLSFILTLPFEAFPTSFPVLAMSLHLLLTP
jgi:hypothetical protein